MLIRDVIKTKFEELVKPTLLYAFHSLKIDPAAVGMLEAESNIQAECSGTHSVNGIRQRMLLN